MAHVLWGSVMNYSPSNPKWVRLTPAPRRPHTTLLSSLAGGSVWDRRCIVLAAGMPRQWLWMRRCRVATTDCTLHAHSAAQSQANRDRFVLSNGHSCALLYSMLHLTGYDLSVDDLKQFRQLGSRYGAARTCGRVLCLASAMLTCRAFRVGNSTPGHPENHLTSGVEVSTGPLGQGACTRSLAVL